MPRKIPGFVDRRTIDPHLVETLKLRHKLAPYQMLEREEAFQKEQAKKRGAARTLAIKVAGTLKALKSALEDLDEESPLDGWIFLNGPEVELFVAEDLIAAASKSPPPVCQRKRHRRVKLVEVFSIGIENIAKELEGPAGKVGAPRKTAFKALCKELDAQGFDEEKIAEFACRLGIDSGPPRKTKERVRGHLNRLCGKDAHELGPTLEEFQRPFDPLISALAHRIKPPRKARRVKSRRVA